MTEENETQLIDEPEPSPPPPKKETSWLTVAVAFLLLVIVSFVIYRAGLPPTRTSSARSFRPAPSANQSNRPRTNDATITARIAGANANATRRAENPSTPTPSTAPSNDTPVGGWDTDYDDRALILAENGNFVVYFADGTSMSGQWEQSGRRLCLMPDIGGETCFIYSQSGNTMTLDDATFYRR